MRNERNTGVHVDALTVNAGGAKPVQQLYPRISTTTLKDASSQTPSGPKESLFRLNCVYRYVYMQKKIEKENENGEER